MRDELTDGERTEKRIERKTSKKNRERENMRVRERERERDTK